MNRFALITMTLLILPLLYPSAPVQAAEVTTRHQGLTLVGNLELAEGKALKDGLILLTHGMLAHGRMEIITAQQELLKERGFSSLAINLSLGIDNRRGMYDCNVTHKHKVTDALDEFTTWLDWLAGQGSGSVVMAGHSNGGRQTSWFAAERSHPLVKKYVLIAPGTHFAEQAARNYKKNYNVELAPIVEIARKAVNTGKGKEILSGTGVIYCPKATVTAESFLSYYDNDPHFHTPNNIPNIKLPVLVIIGSEDTVSNGVREAVEPLADGKRVKFVEIEDAGHFFRDLYGEDLADEIADFVADVFS